MTDLILVKRKIINMITFTDEQTIAGDMDRKWKCFTN
ncbi:MAG: hypothetical protein IKP28_06835 [Clostridia bacterium]|nr:hypothetical protein [Clostridia bacterium]